VPHILGNPNDMGAIMDFATRHNLWVVEDVCDALGAKFAGKHLGTFGQVATYSFYPSHHITMGEGGLVTCNDLAIARGVRSFRDWGRACFCQTGETNPHGACNNRFGFKFEGLPAGYDHKYVYNHIGYNLKPLDIQPAIGLEQLKKLPLFHKMRLRNFNKLYQALKRYEEFFILPRAYPGAEPSWFSFILTLKPEAPFSRQELVTWLEGAKIETRMLFAGNILRHPGYQGINHRVAGSLKNADYVLEHTFFVGVYPGITEEMSDYMIARFEEFLKRYAGNWV